MVAEHWAKFRKTAYGLLLVLTLLALTIILLRLNTTPNAILAGSKGDPQSEPVEAQDQEPGDPNDPNDKRPIRPLHEHPAFGQRVDERARMVSRQIESRAVKDPNVLKAMRVVPRHAFVRSTEQRYAYVDSPLPIGLDQTISQPYIVAFMTEALQLNRDSKVLEIGTGSGYQAAVCAEIAEKVYTIEIVE